MRESSPRLETPGALPWGWGGARGNPGEVSLELPLVAALCDLKLRDTEAALTEI